MTDLRKLVQAEITRLEQEISTRETELTDLRDVLTSHEKVVAMLENGSAPRASADAPRRKAKHRKAKHRKTKRRKNWNVLLEGLPSSFTVSDVKQAAGAGANVADVHQALLRWRTGGRVKLNGKGSYRKATPKS